MNNLVNVFKKDDKIFNQEERISVNKVYMVSDDGSEKIRRSCFGECEIQCNECGDFSKIKKIQTYHLKKEYFCAKCNHKGEKNPMYGKTFSDEYKKKLSEKYSGVNNPFFGKHHTEKTKEKISSANKGKLIGEKNPMYGVNVYEMIEKNDGKEKLEKIKNKISEACKGEKNGFYGKHHTDEVKKHLSETLKKSENLKNVFKDEEWKKKHREGMLNSEKLKQSRQSDEYRNKKRQQFSNCMKLGTKPKTCFNPKACKVFDKIMEEKGVFIQHAMNGGEYLVEGLGYWLDGYDEKNNVAYEYDEKHHFINGELRESDKKRQKQIEEKLNCKFIRLKDEDYKDF